MRRNEDVGWHTVGVVPDKGTDTASACGTHTSDANDHRATGTTEYIYIGMSSRWR
eukprot:m.160995 g.160995  ORF g.160995 m.160995 type:complete len:55 (-) comp18044_c0_seq7:1739-1903(-)